MFIFLAKILNCRSNLFINNIVREPIIDERFMFMRLLLHGILGH